MADTAKFYQKLNTLVDDIIGGVMPKDPPPLTKKPKSKPSGGKDLPSDGHSKNIEPKTTGAEGDWQEMTASDMSAYIGNLGSGLSNTSNKVHDYLKIVTWVMKNHYPNERVFITSAYRSPEKQVATMKKNWIKNGGNTPLDKPFKLKKWKGHATAKGEKDTMLVYGEKLGKLFHQTMVTGDPSENYWIKHFDKKSKADRANHLSGNAVDFRSRDKPFMSDMLSKTKEYADLAIGNETNRAGPHWHVGIKGIKSIPKPKSNLLSNMEELGFVKEAGRLRALSYVDPNLQPSDVAQSLLRIVYHFVQGVNPESQAGFVGKLRGQLSTIDLFELGGKKKNPGSGIGGTISIIKNILGGQDAAFINAVMQEVVEGLTKL